MNYKDMENFITFKHMANLGDLIASLVGIKKLCLVEGKKAIIYQQLDVPALYYEGAQHPTTDGSGTQVMMNRKMFDMVRGLVEAQTYIHRLEVYEGQHVDYNLDIIRGAVNVNMPYGMIQRWISYWYPELQADTSVVWMSPVPYYPEAMSKQTKNKIVLNFTSRYRNPHLNYYFLKDVQDDCVFLGTEQEYVEFKTKWGLDRLVRFEVANFGEASAILVNCKLFMGNQSFLYNLAEAMKIKRMLELCAYAPNCFVQGRNGSEYLHQHALEYLFKDNMEW